MRLTGSPDAKSGSTAQTSFRRTITGSSRWSAPIPNPRCWFMRENDTASPLYVRTALESATEAAFTLESRTVQPGRQRQRLEIRVRNSLRSRPAAAEARRGAGKYVQAGGSMLIALGQKRHARPQASGGRHSSDCSSTPSRPDNEPRSAVAQVDTSYPSFGKAQNWDGVEFFQT